VAVIQGYLCNYSEDHRAILVYSEPPNPVFEHLEVRCQLEAVEVLLVKIFHSMEG